MKRIFRKVYNLLNAPAVRMRKKAALSMPCVALAKQHTQGGALLPDRIALLGAMPKGAKVAEVGVADGDFSAQILRHCRPARLHLIDAWGDPRFAAGKTKVSARFSAELMAGQVSVHQGLSTEVLPTFPAESLDWVYIDTNHNYATTAAELQLSARLVTAEGRICGHDFCTGNVVQPVLYGVVQAVNEFCVNQGWRYEFVTLESSGHFSFCLRRI